MTIAIKKRKTKELNSKNFSYDLSMKKWICGEAAKRIVLYSCGVA